MIQFKHFQTGEVLAMHPEFPFDNRISSAANYAEAVRRILYSDKSDRVEGWVYQDGQPVGYLWYDPTMSMAEYEEEMDNEALDVVTFSEEGEDGTLLGVATYEVWNRPQWRNVTSELWKRRRHASRNKTTSRRIMFAPAPVLTFTGRGLMKRDLIRWKISFSTKTLFEKRAGLKSPAFSWPNLLKF